MPKLTFVLPIWNGAFVFAQTIESLMTQTEDDIEMIVIDDGSTDGIRDMLFDIDDARFKIVTNDKRLGAGMSRNIGNALAKSPIICVTDCGDIYYDNKASETIKYFNDNPDIDIMCSGNDSLAGGKATKPRLYKAHAGEKLGFEHPAVAYKKTVTDKIKYRTTSIHTDQYDAFFFEAGKEGFKFGIYEQPLSSKCTFNKHDGGRDLDKALLVKIGIYREFNIPIPEWLSEHEKKMLIKGA